MAPQEFRLDFSSYTQQNADNALISMCVQKDPRIRVGNELQFRINKRQTLDQRYVGQP